MRWLVLVSYCFVTLAQPRIFSKVDLIRWEEQSAIYIARFVKIYKKAAADFAQRGPLAFVENFPELSDSEKKWFMRQLVKIEKLPALELDAPKQNLSFQGAVSYRFPVKEVSYGVFSFPEGRKVYNHKLGIVDNFKQWRAKRGESVSRFLNSLLLPSAEANPILLGAVAGALVAVLLAFLLGKKNNSQQSSSEHGGTGGSAPYTPIHEGPGASTGGTSGGGTATGGGGTAGDIPSADLTGLGADAFPKEGEELAGCPPTVRPGGDTSKMSADQQSIYDLMGRITGDVYERGAGIENMEKTDIEKVAAGGSHKIPKSMCSIATYFLYLAYLKKTKPTENIDHLYPKAGQTAGKGPWGYWNANGPGTAAYFKASSSGTNFGRLANGATDGGRPGDFLKIIWKNGTDVSVGAVGKEGHSVVFLGCEKGKDGKLEVCTWGSHTGSGIGVKCFPKDDIGLLLYSRPNNNIPPADKFPDEDKLISIESGRIRGLENSKKFMGQYI